MLRHSVSQIFTSDTPHEHAHEGEGNMFSSLQPSRPRLQPPPPTFPPLNQQPSRPITTPNYTYTPPGPRNQIEALPPNPLQARQQIRSQELLLDAATRHPVFFTDRLKKAPVGVKAGSGAWISPVAEGYVFNDGVVRRGVEGGVKL